MLAHMTPCRLTIMLQTFIESTMAFSSALNYISGTIATFKELSLITVIAVL